MIAGTDRYGTEALDETSPRDPGRPGVRDRLRHVRRVLDGRGDDKRRAK
jgi:hypothetical protein